MVGALRSEKFEMTAQLKKQQARIQYLEGMVEKLNKEVCVFKKIIREMFLYCNKIRNMNIDIIFLFELVNFSWQPRQKQVEIDQLKYELNAQRRRDQSEIGALNQRVGELEIQLVEARKEADEYYKATLERNMEVTSLQQQVNKYMYWLEGTIILHTVNKHL